MACHQERENDDIMHMFVVPVIYIQMPPWPPPITIMGRCNFEYDFESRMTQM
jgi:hypothetical protein